MKISYVVNLTWNFRQIVKMKMWVDGIPNGTKSLVFVIPSWSPGSYLIRDYAKNVNDFRAINNISGDRLEWKRLSKDKWLVKDAKGKDLSSVTVEWNIYAGELSVRTSHVDDMHAFIHGPSVFLYIEGYRDIPISLTIVKPEDWEVATGLQAMDDDGIKFSAGSYDELIDSPMEIGLIEKSEFHFMEKSHIFALSGAKVVDANRLATDMRKVPEVCMKIFKQLPYDTYTFLISFRGSEGQGLEHSNSSANMVGTSMISDDVSYERLLRLLVHEYFHLWNGKRICPQVMIYPDLRKENYTELLWFIEGLTSYYQDIIMLRAGLISESRYFELLGDRISLHRSRPGRNVASVEEASFLAWIKHYQPTPDSRNRVPNYYVKGSLIGLVFDLELNRVTDGNSSLDDLMKIIFEVSENEGLTDSVIKRVLSRITGESMEDLYRMIVEEHEEINFNHFLEPFGLRLENVNDSKVDDEEKNFMSKGLKGPGKEGWLGIATSNSSGTPVVQTIFSDSPAYFSSLCNGDEIIAVDGIKVTYETFKGIMKRFKAGDKIEIVIFRDGLLHSVNVTLGENRIDKYKIVPVETPDSEKAEGLRNSWLYRGIKSS